MLLQMTPSDLMKYLWVSCYFECHLLSYHSGSLVVPGKKVDYCNTLVLNITYHYCQSLTLFPYPLLIIFHLSNLWNLSVNQQQCFYPWQNTEGHKKGITRTWITGFPAMETAWVACVLCFWSQYIFLNWSSRLSQMHFQVFFCSFVVSFFCS